jgi:RNA-directed DNA polymerase
MGITLSKQPQELRDNFLGLKSRDDVARLLEITIKQLNFHLYVLPSYKRYKVFEIPKKSGGTRQILAPISPIKIIQGKLKQVLESVYQPKPSAHGFIAGRSIVTNARLHKKRRYVLNIDLENFFPTIHFGRVRGLFMGNPYNLEDEAATILAQICCHNGILPQGAPTSPVISNMICARLDAKLQQLAKEHNCTYSRYADDITFSTTRSKFPSALANLSDIGQVEIGSQLLSIVEENGFKVNPRKTRLQARQQRQEVTGLTVNRYPNVQRCYIKQVRAILHAWRKFGIDSTAQRYFEQYANHRYSNSKNPKPAFQKVVLGKIEFIGMIKGKTNSVYLELLKKFSVLAPEYVKSDRFTNLSFTRPFIYTEGKTDRKHIQAALKVLKSQGLFSNLDLDFRDIEEAEGYKSLLSRLKYVQEGLESHTRPHIFIFDRDLDKKTFEELKGNEDYFSWKNKAYSFVIPLPKHRENMREIRIEFYYNDNDLILSDENNRRLYLSNEFNSASGMHLRENLICKDFNKLKGELKIIDILIKVE